jgi:hypothetical protein
VCAQHGVRCCPLWLREHKSADSSTPKGGLLIVPLLSWYHSTWDKEPDLPGMNAEDLKGTPDFHMCHWPKALFPLREGDPRPTDGGRGLAAWFAALNELPLAALLHPGKDGRSRLPLAAECGRAPPERLNETETYYRLQSASSGNALRPAPAGPQSHFLSARLGGLRLSSFFQRRIPAEESAADYEIIPGFPDEAQEGRPFVISYSHFVPRQELLPEKRMLLPHAANVLPKVAGSVLLEEQIRRLAPDVHVFGHTHVNVDVTIEGVRYLQWALGNPKPREQEGSTRLAAGGGFLCLFDGTAGGEAPEHWTDMGAHYAQFTREPARLAPALP